MRPRQSRRQQQQVPEIARYISTNERAKEIYDLMVDAVYQAQVQNLSQAITYVKEVSLLTPGPVFVGNVAWEEAQAIFNFVTRPNHYNV